MGGGVQDAQRKAWNEAMRSAGGHPSGSRTSRRSDRQKKQSRRDKARKSTADGGGGDSSLEIRDYRLAVRVDALEGVTDTAEVDAEEDEYDELDDGGSSSQPTNKRSKKRAADKKKKQAAAGVVPKRLRLRTLASILMEEAGRPDGTVKKYLDAEARPLPNQLQPPPRKFCPVTGLLGVYTDPKTGLPYANLGALEQIRERAPPWMNLGGSATYSETVKSLRNDEE
eukprot:scaffold37747_cov46-Attheya_sp.AAC.1